jgi:cell wall-associated NlpC family hydrolase
MIKIEINPVSLLGAIILIVFSFGISNCTSFRPLKYDKNLEDQTRNRVVEIARDLEGTRYIYAGKTPGGFDCSGFTRYVYKQVGVKLPASSKGQSGHGGFKKIKDAEPGDLVFFGPPFSIDHVGIVTQNKKGKLGVIHSTNSQGVVEHDIFQIIYWKKRLKFARDVIAP